MKPWLACQLTYFWLSVRLDKSRQGQKTRLVIWVASCCKGGAINGGQKIPLSWEQQRATATASGQWLDRRRVAAHDWDCVVASRHWRLGTASSKRPAIFLLSWGRIHGACQYKY